MNEISNNDIMEKHEISFDDKDLKQEKIPGAIEDDGVLGDILVNVKRKNDFDDGRTSFESNENRSKILRFENDYEAIWTKLRLIVEELIWTKDTNKKSSMELHDVLFRQIRKRSHFST